MLSIHILYSILQQEIKCSSNGKSKQNLVSEHFENYFTGPFATFHCINSRKKKVIFALFSIVLRDFATKTKLVTSEIYFYCTLLSSSLRHFLGGQVSPIWKKLLKSVQLVLHQRNLWLLGSRAFCHLRLKWQPSVENSSTE